MVTFHRYPVQDVLVANLGHEFEVSNVKTEGEDLFTPRGQYAFSLDVKQPEKLSMRLETANRHARDWRRVWEGFLRGQQAPGFPGMAQQPPAKPPATAEEWTELLKAWFLNVPGFKEVTIVSHDATGATPPGRIDVAAELSWLELRDAHDWGFFFGYWKRSLGKRTPGELASAIQSPLIDWFAGWAGIIASVIVTAGFIPNMLTKGTIDLLLVKPLARPTLLLYKYLGGLAFVFLNSSILIVGTWIAFGLTTRNWSPTYLLAIPILTGYFAILYALSVCVGVWTRSALASIVVTIGFWGFVFVLGLFYLLMHPTDVMKQLNPGVNQIEFPEAVVKTVDSVYYVLPKPGDLSRLNQDLVLRNTGNLDELIRQQSLAAMPEWRQTLGTSSAFIVVMLGLACWRFSRQDY
jgi:ABC-type transport system involved in multi-copper enzyme maturation permease subunit